MVATPTHVTLAAAKAAGRPSDRGRFMRMNDVIATIGLSRATVYRLIGASDFPRPHQLTQRTVGWWEADVAAWLEKKRAAPA